MRLIGDFGIEMEFENLSQSASLKFHLGGVGEGGEVGVGERINNG